MIELSISRGAGSPVYRPVLLDGASWETELDGAPGRFTFRILDDAALRIAEGDRVEITSTERNIFQGNIFTRRRNHHGVVSVVAYDQTRYLKNKDTINRAGFTAATLLRKIASDYGLKLGRVADTRIMLPFYVEDNKTLADIMSNALKATEEAGGGQFALYDDFGALCLVPSSETRLALLLREDSAKEFMRNVSIDSDTYNQIKLICNTKDGQYVSTSSDGASIERWGRLQYLGRVSEDENAQAKARSLLRLHNKERKSLSVSGIHGDAQARAGCSLWVGKGLCGTARDALCLIKTARHHWNGGRYSMDLELEETGI